MNRAHYRDAVLRRAESLVFDLGELDPDDARVIRKVLVAKLMEQEQIDRVALSEQIEG